MKKKLSYRRPWFLWIGGACFLVGSLVAGSVGLASSATGPTVSGTVIANQGTSGSSSWPVSASQSGTWQQEITDGTNVLGTPTNPLRTDPTGKTSQPVSGDVGISGSLPAGTNGIGNVGISGSLPAGANDIGTVHVASPSPDVGLVSCTAPDGTISCDTAGLGLATGTVINTLSANCNVPAGQHVNTALIMGPEFIVIPVTFQSSFNGIDDYYGTLTNLDFPEQSGGSFVAVGGDYIASGGNGALCRVTYVATGS